MGATNADPPSYEEDQRCRGGIPEQAFRTGLKEEELIRCIDVMALSEEGWLRGVGDYQAELTRREAERQGKRLEWLTWALFLLTLALVISELLPRILAARH
jgi:hypothetical protein